MQYLALESETMYKDEDAALTWRATPKLHLLEHIMDEVSLGAHPKDSSTYIDMKGHIQALFYRRCGRHSFCVADTGLGALVATLASLGLRRCAGGFCVAGAGLGALQGVGCTPSGRCIAANHQPPIVRSCVW